ncbi:prenyltransferase [Trypanosoma cruzi Dm28c]|uniref:4-hydroxybenzoate polyprenyltransferase, mitochondrial n=2 Tax=Trypanosoma cruzi TaxID=5693 RepID=V5BFC2_TRYCR|nr:prenyltransferase [Trypanosoma cruzi Dm28c]PBJ72229.1 prenyltransferase [Trypanosoma cruzi cruzi]PWV00682.1 putative prenyltransferase [Trypanosoma cruzi]
MLRRAFFFRRITRSWTKGSITASMAHFPDAVRADPAALRGVDCSAREKRQWTIDDVSRSNGRKVPKHIEWLTNRMRLWARLVRADRPVGTVLLMLPCYWGSSLAVTKAIVWEGADPVALFAPFIPVHLAVLFTAGAFLMRNSGCVVNDMLDRKFDELVSRTKTRPLANREIGMTEASVVLFLNLSFAFVIAMNLSPMALLAALSIVPLVAVYPLMKRVTYMPQFFLGLCFNWGIFVGYAAVLNRVDLAVTLPIFCSGVVWTILYDTIYAYQDRDDDMKCGVKSSAILIGDRKYILTLMIFPVGLGILISGLMVSQSLPFYIATLLCIWHLQGIVDDVNIYDASSCGKGFLRNARFGIYIFLAMCLGNVFWTLASEHQRAKDADNIAVPEKSALMRFLLFRKTAESPAFNTQDIRWIDRMAHPVYVAAQEVKQDSTQKPLVIPAWMRREYLGENLGNLMLLLGVENEFVVSWQEWWYAQLDHYNMFSKLAI